MKIGTVNLRSGGNKTSVVKLFAILAEAGCTSIVFSEFRDNAAGQTLLATARATDFADFAYTADVRGVLIVARDRFEPTFNPDDFSTHSSAIIKADFGSHIVYGAYLPTGARKFAHFDYLIEAARIHNAQGDRAVAIGDFNAGQNEIDIQINATSGKMRDEFPAHSRFLALNELWPEAWRRLHPRAREYSWYASNKPISQKQGWRLDHAFVSQAMLPNLRKAAYLPETRQLDLTDHSALVVEFDNLV